MDGFDEGRIRRWTSIVDDDDDDDDDDESEWPPSSITFSAPSVLLLLLLLLLLPSVPGSISAVMGGDEGVGIPTIVSDPLASKSLATFKKQRGAKTN